MENRPLYSKQYFAFVCTNIYWFSFVYYTGRARRMSWEGSSQKVSAIKKSSFMIYLSIREEKVGGFFAVAGGVRVEGGYYMWFPRDSVR